MAGIWLFLLISFFAVADSRPRQNGLKSPNSGLPYKCHANNSTYRAGRKFRPDPCTLCHCSRRTGRAMCSIRDCMYDPACVKFETDETVCCPKCVQYGCLHRDKKSYPLGAEISRDLCERCYCPLTGGRTVCERTVSCQAVPCADHVIPKGSCCPVCPNGPTCRAGTEVIRSGAEVEVDGYMCRCPNENFLLLGIVEAFCKSPKS